jgi:hypothetical protein
VRFASGSAGNAALDLKTALDAAETARDSVGHDWLQTLMFEYLAEKLAKLSPRKLAARLATLQIWRQEGLHPVFKSVGEPALAFTVLEFDDGLKLVALGFCYRYPGSEEAWWRTVIQPRLRMYL